jgi:hypothetical protein
MRSRVLLFAAAVVFLGIAAFELRSPINVTAVVVNAVAGVIFAFLGAFPAKPTKP